MPQVAADAAAEVQADTAGLPVGAAVASRVAVGGAAAAPVSVGANADAGLVITEATKMQDVAAYLTANCPGLCPALRWLLSLGAA